MRELANREFQRHSARIAEFTRTLGLVERRYVPFQEAPEQSRFKVVKPGTAGALIHRVATQIVSDKPIVTYTPRNDSPTARSAADNIEHVGMSILRGIAHHSMIPPLEDAAKKALMGMYVLKGPLFDFNAWDATPRRKGFGSDAAFKDAMARFRAHQAERFPFIVKSIDPRTVVWDQHNPLNPRWAIEKRSQPVELLRDEFPHWENARRRRLHDEVDVIEYWTPHWRVVLADDQPASYLDEGSGKIVTGAVENIYGYVPYSFGFGVWGFSDGGPEDMARSMLYFIEDELIEEARVASVKSWRIQLYGMPILMSKNPEQLAQELRAMAPIVTADDEKNEPRPMRMPDEPPHLERWGAEIAQKIELNSVSSGFMGFRQEGMTSGIMSGLHIGEARQQFAPIVTRLGMNAGRILDRAAWLIENVIQEPVSLWMDQVNGRDLITVKPGDYRGAYHHRVDLEPVDPTRDDRRGMLGLNYFAQGLLDPWTTLEEFLRHPDANKVIKRIMMWRVINSQRFTALLENQAAQEAQMEELLQELDLAGKEGVAPESIGDFEVLDQAGAGQVPMTPENQFTQGGGLDAPTRGQPLEQQGRLGARVAGPLNTRQSGPR